MRIPEILAPAGSFDAFLAAVENGADAVYLGGKRFSARASAENFDDLELKKAVEYAHFRGVRVYVTINILIDNSEILNAIEYIKKLYDFGVDGVIVQDMGLIYLIRLLLPDLRIHASTQMTVHNLEGVRFLEKIGVKRVVMAREVSLDDIINFNKRTSLELEVFGHGALCVSYSGQCLMSSLIGERSGNRGRCAQPCRMTYTLVDENSAELGCKEFGVHLLSPRDLNTLELLPEICTAGITSLKLEGRMKRPEYVATVVRVYREALNRLKANPKEYSVSKEEQRMLAQIFNRDFTTGYLKGNPGYDLMSFQRPNNRGVRLGRIERILNEGRSAEIKLDDKLIVGDGVEIWVKKGGRQGYIIEEIYRKGTPVNQGVKGESVIINITGKPRVGDRIFKTHDASLIDQAKKSYLKPSRLITLNLDLWAREGSHFILKGSDNEGNNADYVSQYIVEEAQKHPARDETVIKQLDRLGGTGFKVGTVSLDIEGNIMLPASELNTARRFIVERITELRLEKFQHPSVAWNGLKGKFKTGLQISRKSSKNIKISVTVSGYEAGKAAIEAGADVIYLGGEVFSQSKLSLDEDIRKIIELGRKYNREIVYILPRIFQEKEKNELFQRVSRIVDTGISGILFGNIGGLTLAKNIGWTKGLYADFGLNIFNNFTIKVLAEAGIRRITLSPELNFTQIGGMGYNQIEKECIVHGALPMMISEYCALGSLLGGKRTGTACNHPCKKGFYGLKDRMNYIFPIEVDQFCRMHIFNPKELCLIQDMDKVINSGIDIVRIEGKRYDPGALFKIVNLYRIVKERFLNGVAEKLDLEDLQSSLAKLSTAGFTKGHYFRGVLE